MEKLEIKVAIQVARKREAVFEAIVDPGRMSNYFISESTGKMAEGKSLTWKFPEFEETVPVKVLKVKPDEFISFQWDGAKGKVLQVDMELVKMADESTVVRITEGKMDTNEAGIKWLGENTEGWANFLACLKAYMEYGINLRKGAFDFMKKIEPE